MAVFIGIVGHAVSSVGRIPMLEGSATETVIVRLSDLLSSYGLLPAIVAGCILAGILAATMSTADSQLLAAASAFSENVLQDVFGVKLTSKQNMLAARLTVVVIAFIAIFLAADPNSNVFKIVSFAWAGFRRNLWPRCAVRPFLETQQPAGCAGRSGGRRSDDLCMEILRPPLGGHLGHL